MVGVKDSIVCDVELYQKNKEPQLAQDQVAQCHFQTRHCPLVGQQYSAGATEVVLALPATAASMSTEDCSTDMSQLSGTLQK